MNVVTKFNKPAKRSLFTLALASLFTSIVATAPAHAGFISSSSGSAIIIDVTGNNQVVGTASGEAPGSYDEDSNSLLDSIDPLDNDISTIDLDALGTISYQAVQGTASSDLNDSSMATFITNSSATIAGLSASLFSEVGDNGEDLITISNADVTSQSQVEWNGSMLMSSGSASFTQASISFLGETIAFDINQSGVIFQDEDALITIFYNEIITPTCTTALCEITSNALRINFAGFSLADFFGDNTLDNQMWSGDIIFGQSTAFAQANANVSEPHPSLLFALGLLLVGTRVMRMQK